MSAYMVDRHHIIYLAKFATRPNTRTYAASILDSDAASDDALTVAVANELARANAASIETRYPDTQGDAANAPGDVTTFEPFSVSETRDAIWHEFTPVRVLKAAACFTYQSSESEGWDDSLAHRLVGLIQGEAIRRLPGFEDADWGAPLPESPLSVRRTRARTSC
jgi:hypothetical protein